MSKIRTLFVCLLTLALVIVGCSPSADNESTVNKTVPNVKVPEGGNVEAVKQLPDKKLRIAFLSFQNNPFWFPVRDGALAAKEYLKKFHVEVDYIVMGDDLTSDRVVSAMETAITKQYDAIAVAPVFDGTEGVINKAVSSGIPVITFVAEGSKKSQRLAFIGQDAISAGKLAGQEIEKLTNGQGKIGVITGVFGATQHEQRMNGALDYLKKNVPGVQVVGKYENKDQAETAYQLTKNLLTAHPDLKVVYVTAGGPFGASKAIKDMGLTGKVKVVCFDHIPENVKYVRSGEIAAAIAQDPFGQGFDSLVRLFNHLVTKQKPEQEFFPVKLDVLTPENVDELFPE